MSDTKDDRRNDGEQAKAASPAGDGPDRQGWETRAVFRETYLSLYAEPEIRAAYRRVGIAIYEGALAREETYTDRFEPGLLRGRTASAWPRLSAGARVGWTPPGTTGTPRARYPAAISQKRRAV